MLAGGGVAAHPDGPGAGVRSLRQAWEAAVAGVPPAVGSGQAGPKPGTMPSCTQSRLSGKVPDMPAFGFVADDLTGAADVLAQSHRYGLEAALVIGDAPLPTDTDVVGFAGPLQVPGRNSIRQPGTQGPWPASRALNLEVLLYKVCSTFDSSVTVGSIGRGIQLLHEQFPLHGPIPVVPAQPAFGRYTAFSNHYATHAGQIYRLDRHPVMSRHPSTPMAEADLRQVLAEQLGTGEVPGAIHLPAYEDGTFKDAWADRRRDLGAQAFVVDAVDERHMDAVAEALTREEHGHGPSIVVGSGGIMAALARSISRSGSAHTRTAAAVRTRAGHQRLSIQHHSRADQRRHLPRLGGRSRTCRTAAARMTPRP